MRMIVLEIYTHNDTMEFDRRLDRVLCMPKPYSAKAKGLAVTSNGSIDFSTCAYMVVPACSNS